MGQLLFRGETSCCRHRGEGLWADFAAALSRRATETVAHDP